MTGLKFRSLRRIADLLGFFLQRKVFRKKIPLLASFKLTFRCNLNCLACPYCRRAGEPGSHMSWNDAVSALKALKRSGVRIIIFEGGEPFLWKDGDHDLRALICYAKTLFSTVAATTNGTFPLDVPADILWVSVDGGRENHNRLRSGSFDRVWKNLQAAHHQRVLVHFTLNRENREDLEEVLTSLKELPAVKGTTVQLFYPYDQGEASLSLSPEERIKALDMVMALKKEHRIFNSRSRLQAMKDGNWVCHDDVLINVDPDGTITQGCYVKSRGKINCRACGFTPVAEASGALDLKLGSLWSGCRTFL